MNPVIVEEIVSEDRLLKVEIRRRIDGNLQLFLFYWYEENLPEYGHFQSGWAPRPPEASITDTLEIARAMAEDLLRTTMRPAVR
jgi:hypothetical protein